MRNGHGFHGKLYGKAEIFQLVFQPHSARRAFDGELFASSVGTAQAHLRSGRPKMGEMGGGQWFLGIFKGWLKNTDFS